MRTRFVLPLPRFILHPITAVIIAAVHIYLAAGHLAELISGDMQWTHLWKGCGALLGAYVFVALASRRMPSHLRHPLLSGTGGGGVDNRNIYSEE